MPHEPARGTVYSERPIRGRHCHRGLVDPGSDRRFHRGRRRAVGYHCVNCGSRRRSASAPARRAPPHSLRRRRGERCSGSAPGADPARAGKGPARPGAQPPHTCGRHDTTNSSAGNQAAPLCRAPPHERRLTPSDLAARGSRALAYGGGSIRSRLRRSWNLLRSALLSASRTFPGLACGGGHLTRALGLALGLFQAFAGTFELILCDAHPLLGDIRLQAHPLEWLGGGTLFAACLFHPGLAKRKYASFTQGLARFHPGYLSTEFVHNYVDRARTAQQRAMRCKGLRRAARVFANCVAPRVARVTRCRR